MIVNKKLLKENKDLEKENKILRKALQSHLNVETKDFTEMYKEYMKYGDASQFYTKESILICGVEYIPKLSNRVEVKE